jgi:glycosyltransferase involved in cell wall biosynthesis
MIKICFVLPVPLLPLKGASFTCYRQAIALDALGFDVSILSPQVRDQEGLSGLKRGGIRILDWLPARSDRKWIGHLKMLTCSWPSVAAAILKEKPDILHVHNPTDILPMVVSLVNRFTGIPFVFQMNDPGPESIVSIIGLKSPRKELMLASARIMEKIVMSHAAGFTTVNDVLRNQILSTRQPPSSKPFITYYNVAQLPEEHGAVSPRGDSEDVLYVGNLSSDFLGLESLIPSFRRIWERYGAKLNIVGDGPLLETLHRAVESSNASAFINLPGYVPPESIPACLKNARLCIIPYLDTPLTRVATPTKLFEYLLCGKAVVCPDFQGFVEVLGPENPGLYRSAVPGDILRVIGRMLEDDELRTRTESRNRALSSKYTFDGELLKMLALYETVGAGIGVRSRIRALRKGS